jgi:hypothetical protein
VESAEKSELSICESDLCRKVVKPMLAQLQKDVMVQLHKTTIDDLCENAQKANVNSEGRESLDFTI